MSVFFLMCGCLCKFIHAHTVPGKAKDAVGSPGVSGTGDCELPIGVLGPELGSSTCSLPEIPLQLCLLYKTIY